MPVNRERGTNDHNIIAANGVGSNSIIVNARKFPRNDKINQRESNSSSRYSNKLHTLRAIPYYTNKTVHGLLFMKHLARVFPRLVRDREEKRGDTKGEHEQGVNTA